MVAAVTADDRRRRQPAAVPKSARGSALLRRSSLGPWALEAPSPCMTAGGRPVSVPVAAGVAASRECSSMGWASPWWLAAAVAGPSVSLWAAPLLRAVLALARSMGAFARLVQCSSASLQASSRWWIKGGNFALRSGGAVGVACRHTLLHGVQVFRRKSSLCQ